MNTHNWNSASRWRAVRLDLPLSILIAGCAPGAQAQLLDTLSPDAAGTLSVPYALFQYATLTGSGNMISAAWVPVVTASGTIYKNITLQCAVDAAGNLTIAPGYPQIVPALPQLTSAFVAGTYVGPSAIYGGNFRINVSGPGILPGGATEWSLASNSPATNVTYPNSANWYVGPIATSPIAARLSKAGISSAAWAARWKARHGLLTHCLAPAKLETRSQS